MVFWSRLRQSRCKFHSFSNAFRRFYSLNPAPVLANQHISSRKSVPILNYPKFIVQDEQLVFFRKVRFYAKSVKVPQKKAERDDSEPKMNEEITAPTVRLVIDEGNHFILLRHEALARARSLQLDLVEVDRNAKPPVCKIFDYNKEKYIRHTKEKERTKSKSTLRPGGAKEIRFGGKIKQNDLKIKADMVKRLMEKGYRVKCTATDTAEGVDLKALLSKFTALIDDVAIEESGPKYEKKQAFVVVRHIKFGPPKKSSGNKASAAADSPRTKEDSDEDALTKREDSDNNAPTKKSDWDDFDGDDSDAHPIFEIDNEATGQLESSEQETPFSVDRNLRRAAEPTRIPMGMNALPIVRPGQQVESPARAIPTQVSPDSTGQNSPAKSYGIFSAPKVNAAAEAGNRNPRTTTASSPDSTGQNSPAKSSGIFSVPRVNAAAEAGNRNPRTTAASSPDSTGQNLPTKSYGIFSAPKVNSAAAGNRNPRPTAASSPAAADSTTAFKSYGIFSAEEKEKQAQKR